MESVADRCSTFQCCSVLLFRILIREVQHCLELGFVDLEFRVEGLGFRVESLGFDSHGSDVKSSSLLSHHTVFLRGK